MVLGNRSRDVSLRITDLPHHRIGALDEDDPEPYECKAVRNRGGDAVDPLTQATVALLERSDSLALSLDEVRELLEKERPGSRIPSEQIISALVGSRDTVQFVPHPKRRWAHTVGPRAWILVPRVAGEAGGKPGIREKLRSTVAALGRGVEPGSSRQWARWTRMLEEEGMVRRALRRRSVTPEI